MSEQPGKRRRRVRAARKTTIDTSRGVFMISVAAELADMHPQTLRMYEARGLITPKRSPKNTRLYSHDDVERLRRIQRMTVEEGLNLAGVETVLELEDELERTRAELERMRERVTELERQMRAEVERVRRSMRAEIVPYGAYEPEGLGGSERSAGAPGRVRIPIERDARGRNPRIALSSGSRPQAGGAELGAGRRPAARRPAGAPARR